jgi:tRNA(Ile)-lysidine synthase
VLERFKLHLDQTQLIPPGSRILVGYSGGADSTCLLHLLHELGFDVVAAHLHHAQRPEADDEQKQCEAFCNSLNIPFATGKAQVPQMASDLKIGIEEAGRHARYTFFQQAAHRLECDLIATAHTRTDHVETILMNLARGTGLAGLTGIPERRENIVRPLLSFTREQCRYYCRNREFWFHDDPSNEDLSFSRARVRHRIVPELEAINPSSGEAIARMSELVEEEDRFLNGMAAAALEQSEVGLNGDLKFLTEDCEAAFHRSQLESLPPVLFRRAMRLAAGAMGSTLDRNQSKVLEQAVEQVAGSITTEGGEVAIEWSEREYHFRQLQPTEPFRYSLTIPGETISDEFGWQFTATTAAIEERKQLRSELQTFLPTSAIKGNLFFRSVQPGDAMKPLGFSGSRKLADLLSEAKLTPAARKRLPIVCDLVGPLWAPGICLDERASAANATGQAIFLHFGPVLSNPSHNKETSGIA